MAAGVRSHSNYGTRGRGSQQLVSEPLPREDNSSNRNSWQGSPEDRRSATKEERMKGLKAAIATPVVSNVTEVVGDSWHCAKETTRDVIESIMPTAVSERRRKEVCRPLCQRGGGRRW